MTRRRFWYDEGDDSRNAASGSLKGVRPSLATTHGPLIVICSPYARRGEVFETWKRHFGEKGDPRILVAQGASRELNPSLPQSVVDRAMDRDPASAGAGSLLLNFAPISRALSTERRLRRPLNRLFERAAAFEGRLYRFCDPSGGLRRQFQLAIGIASVMAASCSTAFESACRHVRQRPSSTSSPRS